LRVEKPRASVGRRGANRRDSFGGLGIARAVLPTRHPANCSEVAVGGVHSAAKCGAARVGFGTLTARPRLSLVRGVLTFFTTKPAWVHANPTKASVGVVGMQLVPATFICRRAPG
jgi:hypothetical protein